MGWKRIRYVDSGNVWLCSPGVVEEMENEGSAFLYEGEQKGQSHCDEYSSDISAAFEVVSKMRERYPGLEFTLNMWATGEKWEAIFTPGADYNAYAETPALAICLAAQAAITAEGAK
jgi:hypothetical protein